MVKRTRARRDSPGSQRIPRRSPMQLRRFGLTAAVAATSLALAAGPAFARGGGTGGGTGGGGATTQTTTAAIRNAGDLVGEQRRAVGEDDAGAARAFMTRFYALVRDTHREALDPVKAAALEV